jgi:pyruvate ferredoxin oxidoreductase gamma subunit
MGAPVVAFCRIDDREIRLREPVLQPDALIIQDPTLLHQVDVFGGLVSNGFVLINTTRTFDDLGLKELTQKFKFCAVPATDLALKHIGRPLPNAALLGGFAAISGRISLESVAAAIRDKFAGPVAEGNVAAASEAFQYVMKEMREVAGAQAD